MGEVSIIDSVKEDIKRIVTLNGLERLYDSERCEISIDGIYIGPGVYLRTLGPLQMTDEEKQRGFEKGEPFIEKIEVGENEAVVDGHFAWGPTAGRGLSYHLKKREILDYIKGKTEDIEQTWEWKIEDVEGSWIS